MCDTKSVSFIEFLIEFCMYDEILLQHLLIKSNVLYSGKAWQIDSFQAFGKTKFGELIDQSIDY